jgi:rhodanese-related sulfurtransferase
MKNSIFVVAFLFLTSLFWSCTGTAQQPQNDQQPATTSQQQGSSYNNLSVAQFNQLRAENPDAVVLDVRTKAEVEKGMIDGALHIDVSRPDFKQQIQELDKDQTYLVYCRSGRRSVTACKAMEQEGFSSLYNLMGGIIAYDKETK